MQRRKPLARKTPLKKRNPKRRDREWTRAYGSLERCFFVSALLECVVPGCEQDDGEYNENAHIETGGMGRKADADKIVPACGRHHRGPGGMHDGIETFAERWGLDLEQCAADTERAWQTYGAEVVERAKRDGRYQRWLNRDEEL